jgi:hypothetical protein
MALDADAARAREAAADDTPWASWPAWTNTTRIGLGPGQPTEADRRWWAEHAPGNAENFEVVRRPARRPCNVRETDLASGGACFGHMA